MSGTCCVHVQWVKMLNVENSTYALVVNLLYAVLLRWPPVNPRHWSNTFGDPLALLCQLVVWHGDSFFNFAIGSRDNPQSMSVILTQSVCLLSWVMARLCAYTKQVRFGGLALLDVLFVRSKG